MGMTQQDMAMQEGAEPTQDDVFAAQEDERMAQVEAIAASAPMPEKPYSSKLVQSLVDAMNGLLSQVGDMAEQIEFVPEGDRIDGQLPPEVYVPFAIVMGYIEQLGGYEKYVMMPTELVNDAALRKGAAKVKQIAGDAELVAKLQEGEAPVEEEEMPEEEMSPEEMEAGAGPGEFDEEDEAIMQEM
tara:strand:+ start:3282 stop:3839 length:558 start_codon:yes stop_codon:yes gene_type:complete